MSNLVTNEQFAVEQLEFSRHIPKFPTLDFYEGIIKRHSGDRIAMLMVATDLLEIAKRHDPAYGLRTI